MYSVQLYMCVLSAVVFQHITQPSIKWQYFISTRGLHTEFPAHNYGDISQQECHAKTNLRHRCLCCSYLNDVGFVEKWCCRCICALYVLIQRWLYLVYHTKATMSCVSVVRDVYISTVYPQRKNVVLMIDTGQATLSFSQLVNAKVAAQYILFSLSENDRVRNGP